MNATSEQQRGATPSSSLAGTLVALLTVGSWLLVSCERSPTAAPAGTVRAPTVRIATAVIIDPPIDSIGINDRVQLRALVKDQYGNSTIGDEASWESSDTAIASITRTGLVTGKAAGPVTITAAVWDKSGTASLTVKPPRRVTTVVIDPATVSLGIGDTTQLSTVVKDQYGNTMNVHEAAWQSSDTTIASISSAGVVTGMAAGHVVITATVSGVSSTTQLTVRPPAPPLVTSVIVNPATVDLGVGHTQQLAAVIMDDAGATVRGLTPAWQSSDTSIAVVSASGLVTGIAAGPATITATVAGIAGAAQIIVSRRVVAVVTTIAVDPATVTVSAGDTVQLNAVVRDQNGDAMGDQRVTWHSSDTTIVSVSPTGLVTGIASGSATITATIADKTAAAQLFVQPPGQRTVTTMVLDPAITTLHAGDSVRLAALPKDQNGQTMHGQAAAWQSSDTTVAFVSGSGVVTGIGEGIATITATASGKSAAVQLAVMPAAVNTSAPPVATGIWISKAELNELPATGPGWMGDGELKQAADDVWVMQPIERQGGQVYNVQAMAGALVFARLFPDPVAEAYRAKVIRAIRIVMALPSFAGATVTAPNRFLGTWAITADLVNLTAYDPVLDRRFRAWLEHKLSALYRSQKSVRQQMAHANNQGSWACFSLAAASVYLGDRATLDRLAMRTRRWLGDTSVPFKLRWTDAQSWQLNPADSSTWVGINPKGATRDGYNFDGIQPSDQNRGTPMNYDSIDFPNSFSAVRYNETSLHGALGLVLILHRAGYTDLLDASDQALLRAARWIKYAADNFAAEGYQYFTGPHEAVRPLINYLYPSANLPAERTRPQARGRAYGYAWTYWTHQGRRLQR